MLPYAIVKDRRETGAPLQIVEKLVGPGRVELPTPALSERCSNQLSYEPSLGALAFKF